MDTSRRPSGRRLSRASPSQMRRAMETNRPARSGRGLTIAASRRRGEHRNAGVHFSSAAQKENVNANNETASGIRRPGSSPHDVAARSARVPSTPNASRRRRRVIGTPFRPSDPPIISRQDRFEEKQNRTPAQTRLFTAVTVQQSRS